MSVRAPRRSTVVIGFLGTTLDQGNSSKRWERWRPTIALCQQDDFQVDRLDLLVMGESRRSDNHAALLATIKADIAKVSPDTQVVVHHLAFAPGIGAGHAWDFVSVYAALSDFAAKYPFVPARETYYVHITTGTHVAQICLYLLAERRQFPAQLLQTSPGKQGAPLSIIDLDLSQYDALAAREQAHHAALQSQLRAEVATSNPEYAALIAEVETVAVRSSDPILLLGATGTGKTVLAERIFALKQQMGLPGAFVAVNCATLRGDGAMSALFGHVRGAFTGAATAREGQLRRADRGVLFLDEIGELGLDEQAMLLTALEQKSFYPLGGDIAVQSNFQLIAGTQRNLPAAVAAGTFREDLWARLAVWAVRLPALSERRSDIPANLDYELARLGAERDGLVTMTPGARKRFLAFATGPVASWPGNFREFGASVRRMATLAPAGRIDIAHVDHEVARLQQQWQELGRDTVGATPLHPRPVAGAASPGRAASGATTDVVTRMLGADAAAVDAFDRVQLQHVLEVCATAPSLSAAARQLFAVSLAKRTSANDADRLRKYLARWGLAFADVRTRLAGA